MVQAYEQGCFQNTEVTKSKIPGIEQDQFAEYVNSSSEVSSLVRKRGVDLGLAQKREEYEKALK